MKLNAIKQKDGKTVVIPMDRGLFDVFTDGDGWEGNWSRYRHHKGRFFQVGGNRLMPSQLAQLRIK